MRKTIIDQETSQSRYAERGRGYKFPFGLASRLKTRGREKLRAERQDTNKNQILNNQNPNIKVQEFVIRNLIIEICLFLAGCSLYLIIIYILGKVCM